MYNQNVNYYLLGLIRKVEIEKTFSTTHGEIKIKVTATRVFPFPGTYNVITEGPYSGGSGYKREVAKEARSLLNDPYQFDFRRVSW